eukprot:5119984-Pleurochrysis_carterae.AAC.1
MVCGSHHAVARSGAICARPVVRLLSVLSFLVLSCSLCGISATAEEIDEVFEKHDKDGSGALDWKEFRDFGMGLMHQFRVRATLRSALG